MRIFCLSASRSLLLKFKSALTAPNIEKNMFPAGQRLMQMDSRKDESRLALHHPADLAQPVVCIGLFI